MSRMNDRKLFMVAAGLILLPVILAFFGGDKFRYPCQNPDNWDKDFCKLPKCDVTRTCPEHIFKGQRDPRLGPPPTRVEPIVPGVAPQACPPANQNQGVNCGK
jgi:hypothetical protein